MATLGSIHTALLFRGPIPDDTALRASGARLQPAEFRALIDRGVAAGIFDRPKRRVVRALLPDAAAYQARDWSRCLEEVVHAEALPRDEALRAAALWAKSVVGLRFAGLAPGGAVLSALGRALDALVAQQVFVLEADGSVRRGGKAASRTGARSTRAAQLERVVELRVWLGVAMANSDGLMHGEEENLLLNQAVRAGVTRARAQRLLDKHRAPDPDVIPVLDELARLVPADRRRPIVRDLIKLAEVDGALAPPESELLERVAAHLDVRVDS